MRGRATHHFHEHSCEFIPHPSSSHRICRFILVFVLLFPKAVSGCAAFLGLCLSLSSPPPFFLFLLVAFFKNQLFETMRARRLCVALAAVATVLLFGTHSCNAETSSAFALRYRRADDEDLQCAETITTTDCDCSACLLHNSTRLADKCCAYQGIPASLLAFEREDLWIPRLKEFNACTGARVQLTYNGENGVGDEDSMERDLRDDVGVNYTVRGGAVNTVSGAGETCRSH